MHYLILTEQYKSIAHSCYILEYNANSSYFPANNGYDIDCVGLFTGIKKVDVSIIEVNLVSVLDFNFVPTLYALIETFIS